MSGDHRVLAPELDQAATLKGPVSYFPSIEKSYGKTMQEWLDIAADGLVRGRSHMDVVSLLKAEHGMGHGHANAVVAYAKAHLN